MLQHARPLLFGLLAGLAACRGEPETPISVRQIPCRTVLRLPGPEDFAVDRSTSPPRLLVSSRDLRGCKKCPADGIYSVPLNGTAARNPLPLAGRDGCSFHPHGVFLAQEPEGSGRKLLYVINHHDAQDASPSRGCFRHDPGSPARERSVTSVEIFQVETNGLVFLQRLADPDILTNGNDLVAVKGEIWVTAPPGALAQLGEILTHGTKSRVVRFACDAGHRPPCFGKWEKVADLGGFANGIAYREDAQGNRSLYVASSRGKAIHVYRIEGTGLKELKSEMIKLQTHPDNLEWLDESQQTLVVAAHTILRRFVQASFSSGVPSPSEVLLVGINQTKARLFKDDGRLVSAASTGACVDGDLFLGQVFGPGIWRCSRPAGCAGKGGASR